MFKLDFCTVVNKVASRSIKVLSKRIEAQWTKIAKNGRFTLHHVAFAEPCWVTSLTSLSKYSKTVGSQSDRQKPSSEPRPFPVNNPDMEGKWFARLINITWWLLRVRFLTCALFVPVSGLTSFIEDARALNTGRSWQRKHEDATCRASSYINLPYSKTRAEAVASINQNLMDAATQAVNQVETCWNIHFHPIFSSLQLLWLLWQGAQKSEEMLSKPWLVQPHWTHPDWWIFPPITKHTPNSRN